MLRTCFTGCFTVAQPFLSKYDRNLTLFSNWTQWQKDCYAQMVIATVVLFSILSIFFLFSATILLQALAKHFSQFYLKHRCMLITVTILMTIPLAFRAILDGMKAVIPGWADYIDSRFFRNTIYNFCFFLLTTFLPIVSQMGTLVFGYTRYRKQKEIREQQLLMKLKDATETNGS